MTMSGVARGREVPRKTLHLTTAVVPLSLWLGAPQRWVAVVVVGLFGVACAVEVARRRSPAVAAQFNATVGVMLREHERQRGITGATWLLGAFALACVAAPLAICTAATWAGAVGDASAALVGTAWRRARGGAGKTLVGSAACALMSAIGAWWLAGFSVPLAMGLGLVAAVAERPSLSLDDNVRVTAAVVLAGLLITRP